MDAAAIDDLDRPVRELTAIIAAQKAEIGELMAVIAGQKTEIGELKAIILAQKDERGGRVCLDRIRRFLGGMLCRWSVGLEAGFASARGRAEPDRRGDAKPAAKFKLLVSAALG